MIVRVRGSRMDIFFIYVAREIGSLYILIVFFYVFRIFNQFLEDFYKKKNKILFSVFYLLYFLLFKRIPVIFRIIRAYVYDNLKKKKITALLLPEEFIPKKTQLTKLI